MRKIMSTSVAVVAAAVVCSLMGACAVEEPSTASVEAPVLDVSGNWYGSRVFGTAMAQVATAIPFSPFVVNELSTPASLNKVSTGYEQITGIVGETALGTRTHVARFATRFLTKTSDSIAPVSLAQLEAVLVGDKLGDASTSTPPGSCAATLPKSPSGTVTVKAFVPDAISAASEVLRNKLSVTDEGLYTYCKGTVVVSKATGSLVGQTLNASNAVVSFTLTPTCSSSDSADVCIGKQAALTGQIGIGSILANNGSVSRPTIGGVSDADSNIRGTTPAWPLTLNLTLVNDTSQSQMNAFATKISGTGASAFEASLIADGATACSTLTPLACP